MRIEVQPQKIGLVVRVNRWPEGSRSDDYIYSCNLTDVHTARRWRQNPLALHHEFGLRLARNHGEAKGRVLYLFQYRLLRGHVPTCGLAYHVEPRGGPFLQVTDIVVGNTVPEADVVPAADKLLLCAQRVTQVAGLNGGHLQWICKNEDQVRAAEYYYGFKKRRRLDDGEMLMERPPVY
jgi:hypothetical protein